MWGVAAALPLPGRFIAENAGRVIAYEERHVDKSSWCWCTYNKHKMHYMLYPSTTKKYENKTSTSQRQTQYLSKIKIVIFSQFQRYEINIILQCFVAYLSIWTNIASKHWWTLS